MLATPSTANEISLQEVQELRRRLEEEQRLRQKRAATMPPGRGATEGDPANADHKLRPAMLREWTNFPNEQISIWNDLLKTDFVTERHFIPLVVLKEYRKEVRGRMLSSEMDLIIQQLHANPRLRNFGLNEDITFENHANTLTDESNIVADMSSMSLSQMQPRRSSRLATKSSSIGFSVPGRGGKRATQPRSCRPRADQFCIYNRCPKGKIPAFIIEYKAPHKVVHLQKEESPEVICCRVVAAVITQTFSYMIHSGLEYGYLYTGEAFIFLRVLHDDPSTVYYYPVPGEDVLAFTLRALRVPTQDIAWTTWEVHRLETWVMVYDDLLDEISEKDILSSEFKLSAQNRNEYCRASPVKTRSKSAGGVVCNPSQQPRSHIVRTSQDSQSKGKPRQYCSQRSLQGLIKGGKLDEKCPNMQEHCVDRHCLNPTTLILRLDRQLSTNNRQLSMPVDFLTGAKQEELMHSRLSPMQGMYVPAIQKLGVLHGDLIPGNMTWNEEYGRVMFIDFEQATLQPRRLPLRGISSNRKHSRIFQEKSPNKCFNCFELETRHMRHGL
ncbi:hypothetical protein BDW75DRAFT_246740 [Aspergillus navahoensis]